MRPWTVENFGWGALPPRPPGFWLEAKPPQTPRSLKRLFVTFDRGGQTGPPRSNDCFFRPLTTRTPPTTIRRPSDDRPPAVRQPSTVPMVLRYLLFLPDHGYLGKPCSYLHNHKKIYLRNLKTIISKTLYVDVFFS